MYISKEGNIFIHLTTTWTTFESIWLTQLEEKFSEIQEFTKELNLKTPKNTFDRKYLFSTNRTCFNKTLEQLKAVKNAENSSQIDSFIEKISQEVSVINDECTTGRNLLLKTINSLIPNFIFFSQFER
jgi:primosomal protein N''